MRFDFKLIFGFVTTFALFFILGIYSYHNNQSQLATHRWINHTNYILYSSEQLLTSVIDLETGQRGYSLTGKEEFLEPFIMAKDSSQQRVKKLLVLTQDNPRQQARIKQLDSLVQLKIDFSIRAIKARKEGLDKTISLISSLEGKKLMDQIRHMFGKLQQEETRLLALRSQENERQIDKFNLTFLATVIVTLIILVTLYAMIYFNLKARNRAEQELLHANAEVNDLYDNAPCGYHSLDSNGYFLAVNHTLLHWLGYKAEELVGVRQWLDIITQESKDTFKENFSLFKKTGSISNLEFTLVRKDGSTFPVILNSSAIYDNLGNYLKSRSTTFDYTEQKIANNKIKNLNQELEAFSYSVSHDLRSPLRSITGYTQILQEDYNAVLDDEGKRVTNVIVNSTRRMGQLIDDLLHFSQIGRKELSRNNINMNDLVQQILTEIQEQNIKRNVQLKLLTLHPAYGDTNMLRQVWYNLISNAMKYSQKKDITVLEIGSYPEGQEICYYIKDNGAGFDMQYVHKLYGVFQRLHKINEFEGTGVGLAIVKRVIIRHGGRVWAEGQPDEGATFYFTLPLNNI